MKTLLSLAWASGWSRRWALMLTVLSVATTGFLLVTLDLVRVSAKQGFSQSVSGADLVVGARSSQLSLVLYSVFHLGEPTAQVPMDVFEELEQTRGIKWVLPLSLGDSYEGFAVVGTVPRFFELFRYGSDKALGFQQGGSFQSWEKGQPVDRIYQAVIGHQVAKAQNLEMGSSLVLTHGKSLPGLKDADHADKPFTVVGILEPTGTPIDRSVMIGLEGLEAIHLNWQAGRPMPGLVISADLVNRFDLTPKQATSALVALDNRAMVFRVKRQLETQTDYPLTAAMPGVVLAQLWETVSQVESILVGVTSIVGTVSILGLIGVLLVTLGQRQQEILVFRATGASRLMVSSLLVLEAFWVMVLGCLFGLLSAGLMIVFTSDWVLAQYGLNWVNLFDATTGLLWLGTFGLSGVLLGVLPGWLVYKRTVHI